jgi:CubicO group peptidase (beta-lactamase class C family)
MRRMLATTLAVATICTSAALAKKPLSGGSGADSVVARLQKQYDVPGAQFAAAVNGSIDDTKSFGDADVSAKEPVTNASLFALASGSKPFTAMAIFKLIDGGKLTLATKAFPLLKLTGTDKRFATITIAQLLNHSSGLNGNIKVSTTDPMDIAKQAVKSKLLFTPGQKQVYSNTGFNVLGAVIEKASGEDYHDFVRANVFAPAGVTDEAALDLAKPIAGEVKQYDKSGKPATNTIALAATPAGGWVMSATDVVKVLVAFDAGKIVSSQARAAMLGPLPKPLKPRSNGAYYGYGWDVVYHDSSGRVVYGKNGGTTGAYTWMEHDASGADFAMTYNGGKSGQDAQWATSKPIETALAR